MTAANASGAIQSLQRPEPIIRADALAHVVFERRDMEAMLRAKH